ncbi:hypothetical protein B0T18DRAFT_430180 [Schizothecium vesticola]|uniref:Coiled-coil domain-containing protein 16 n=1 Tax=Schizothecium vesticola TaxID=314040 RepID=A0AA40K1V6_9PEZI|nr:hypothetical protein B0T18DRAFT_430180 [Schizothecium vesticola]
MADVRALLRQQRAARRIDHPAAAYSDAGKLLCTLCHEHIKTESLWESHLRTASHRQRLQPPSSSSTTTNPPAEPTNGSSAGPHKRKLDDPDVDMTADSPDSPDGDAVRRKRSRPDMVDTTADTTIKPKPLTPPLTRRQSSSTPTLGVEMQIPSRPATPVATSSSFRAADATPKPAATPKPQQPLPPTSAPEDNNDDVWAAFEADVVHAKPAPPPPAVAGFADDSGAVISAPAMSAAEIAAKSHDEEHEKQRALADVQRDDEREDATRALEAEFEVMEELEARARRLRERREALRVQGSGEVAATSEQKGIRAGVGKENSSHGMGVVEEEEDEEEDEEDDWDGFRFRA